MYSLMLLSNISALGITLWVCYTVYGFRNYRSVFCKLDFSGIALCLVDPQSK